jgi:hypothetical protein
MSPSMFPSHSGHELQRSKIHWERGGRYLVELVPLQYDQQVLQYVSLGMQFAIGTLFGWRCISLEWQWRWWWCCC